MDIHKILAALAFNKAQMAAVLQTANSEKINKIRRSLERTGVSDQVPLNARFVRHPLEKGGKSLLDTLTAEEIDTNTLENLLRQAKKLTQEAETKRLLREEQWRKLGYNKPTDEERRETLNRNIALLGWPKL